MIMFGRLTDGALGRAALPAFGLAVFCLLLALVWGHEGEPSVTWMNMLDLREFRSAADVWTYLAGLRTGIPPVLSALELLWWVEFRDLAFFSAVAYPAAIALAFTLAVLVQPRRPAPILAVLLLALPLAWQGVRVHAGNPALYDPLFGALLLGYFALLACWLRSYHPAWLAAAGTVLAIVELTRPFVIYLLPLFVLVEVHRIRRAAPRARPALLAFLLPIVVLSGGWHLHLHLAHDGQIPWTNISGYNLQRGWDDFDPEIRDAKHIVQPPRPDGLWDDLNRSDVHRDSERIKRLIVSKILEDPVRAAGYAAERVASFAAAPTRIYEHDPRGAGVALYRGVVVALNLLAAAYVLVGAVAMARRRRWPWLSLRWWLGASVVLTALLVAVGEKGEEARFIFSILPMLLAVAGFALDGLLGLTGETWSGCRPQPHFRDSPHGGTGIGPSAPRERPETHIGGCSSANLHSHG
jgi:hypothetical protein